MYPIFADHAKKYGLDVAVVKFSSEISPERVEEFRRQFEADLAKVQGGGPPIITAGLEDWYSGPNEDSRYWNALRADIEKQDWPLGRLESLDTASSTVAAHTPRPSRSSRWDAKGLVVGYVQSGKTTNFTAVIAKLADEDYQLVIVLSGLHNGLRRQTQERLDRQLKELNPGKWNTLTSEEHDFRTPTQHPSAALGGDKIALAVVKKNTSVLKRLVRWLERPDGRRALQTARVLIVDDEADQASVATTSINPLIMRLMKIMPLCTYIGYTATPFANVFIDPSSEDLYPKDFILNLPRPKGYFGPEVLFGRDLVEGEDDGPAPDGYDMIRIVPDDDLPLLRPSRKVAPSFTPTATDELVDAVHWFWLATAARYARGDRDHSTMLVHTVVDTVVHRSYRPLLQALQERALDGLRAGDAAAWDRFRNLWEKESPRVQAEDRGRELNYGAEFAPHLDTVVASTRGVLSNSRSKERLDYSGDPVVAIAVGANTLSRGLTLNGLVCSFFVRNATAYDTLLQMGRWFGFRPGYEDLPRIWTTASLRDSFRHLAAVEHEMRDDIDRYQRENLTPSQVAVRIQTHPSLRITAKMGAAQWAYISYAGRRLQTRFFPVRDRDWLTDNLDAAGTLIQNASRQGLHEPPAPGEFVHLFRDVPVGAVRTFLDRYRVHADSPDLERELLLSYIDKQLEADRPSLEKWTVAVVGGTETPVNIGGLDVQTLIRSRLNDGNPDRADIKTLMSKQDRVLDLDITTAEARADSEQKLAERRQNDPVHRDRGLLVLYPIDAHSAPVRPERIELNAADTVIGVGLVFPGKPDTSNRIKARHMAVSLADVTTEDLDEILNTDTEDDDG
ncbi:MAG: Z1 domain-containing protein [Pseudonocardiaceae bacterium]